MEMYRGLVPVYLRGAEAAVMVYDVCDRETFKSLGHWYDILLNVVPASTIVCIVGNKIDRVEDTVVDDSQAKSFAQTHNAQWFKGSALTGEGLSNLFESLAEKLLERTKAERRTAGVDLVGDSKTDEGTKKGCSC
jgi:GTPase SAR1 family protein